MAEFPAPSPAEPGPETGSTLDFLLRRMQYQSDFPALSDSVVRIQSIVNSDRESVGTLTNEILKDVALTNKLLRLVNSAHFGQGGTISTVSRAVSLVGFNGIRNMALSLVLLEHMQDKTHATLLRDEFLRSLMAGSIAAELCPLQSESEEAFIGSMFQNLGRLLAEFYFPDDAREIRSLMAGLGNGLPVNRQPLSEASASTKVLGLNYEGLGVGIARIWGLPDTIQHCMRRPAGEPPGRVSDDPLDRVRWVAVVANDVADTLLRMEPKEVDAALALLAKRYARVLGLEVRAVQAAIARARHQLIDLAHAMELKILPNSLATRLLVVPDHDLAGPSPESESGFDPLDVHELQATQISPSTSDGAAVPDVRQINEVLTAGIQDITNAMVEDIRLVDVLRMVLETMYRAMDFRRIIFCMRDAKTDTLTGRFGLGHEIEKFVKPFKVPLASPGADLFAAVSVKGTDTMISDATEPRLAQRLPAWYRQTINAPTFLLLPLHIKGAPFGLIYADKSAPGGLVLDEKELALLRTLRNQAIMAFRQSN
jgi:HD-like signal output (HDOD) protein